MLRQGAKNHHEKGRMPAVTKVWEAKWPEIPAEAPYLASTAERVVCGDWMVVCVVRYEPLMAKKLNL